MMKGPMGRWLPLLGLLYLLGFGKTMAQEVWPFRSPAVANTYQAVASRLQAAHYQAADSLLRAALRAPDLAEADRCQLLLTWAHTLTLSAQFARAIDVIQYTEAHCAATMAHEPHARAFLAECIADIATELQQRDLRQQIATQLEQVYAQLDAHSPRRTILARKIAVLHRMSKNQQAAYAWLATARRDLNGRCIDEVRLLTEEALQANKAQKSDTNLLKLDAATALSKQCSACTPEDLVQRQVAYAEYYLETSQQSPDPIAQIQQEEQALTEMEALAARHPEIISAHYAYGLRLQAETAMQFGEFQRAEVLAHKALDAQLRRGVAPKMISASYNCLGQICHYLGRLEEALQYFRLALVHFPQEEDKRLYIIKLHNYGQELIENEQFAEGEHYVKESIAQMVALDSTDQAMLGNFYLNLAVSYDHQQCYAEGLRAYDQAANYLQQSAIHALEAQARIGSATMYLKLGDLERARAQADLCKAAISRLSGLSPMTEVSPLLDLATFHELSGDLEAALRTNGALVAVVVPDDTTTRAFACPDLKRSISPWYALAAVDQRMGILWKMYAASHELAPLEAIVHCGEAALAELRRLRQGRTNEDDKLKVNQKWRKLHENTMRAAMELYHHTQDRAHLHTAYEVAEQSRAMMLMEAIVENRVLEMTEATASMARQKRNLEARMSATRQKLVQATGDKGALKTLEAEMLDLQAAFDSLLSQIQAANPKYYNMVYGFDVVQIPALQARLRGPGQSLVEFFYGEDMVYTFVVTPDTFAVFENAVTKPLVANLRAFTQSLHTIPSEVSPESAKAYALQSQAITEVLWQPIAPLLRKEVTIIPDGPLSLISFDAFVQDQKLASEVKFQDLHYFVERYTISYQYSATLFSAPQPARLRPARAILAMAPSFEGNPKIAPLTQSQAGVLAIADDFEAVDALAYAQATKAAFVERAPEYQVLQLATHGAYDRKNFLDSRIYFAADGDGDSVLYLRELYTMSLPADLAILEACETGLGNYQQGEGMMSLARGFTYAGCRSVLMSLWEVAEAEATRTIIHGYYDHLAHGLPRDEAIAASKRDFLQSVRDEGGSAYWYMHPFYWSELVLIGEQGPLEIKPARGNLPWTIVISGLLALVLGWVAWWIWKRKIGSR